MYEIIQEEEDHSQLYNGTIVGHFQVLTTRNNQDLGRQAPTPCFCTMRKTSW